MGSRLSASVSPFSAPSSWLGQRASSNFAPTPNAGGDCPPPFTTATSRDGATTSSSQLASLRLFHDNARRHISKLTAFEAYQQRTSLTQSVGVLLVTPIPCIVVVLLLDSIPLASPALGWQANGVYYVRMLLGAFVVATAVACAIEEFIPEIQLPWPQLSVIDCVQALVFVGTVLGIAAAGGVFSVPFSLLIPVGPMMLAGTCIHYSLVRSKIMLTTNFPERYRHVIEVIQLESVPLVLYPVYATLFMQLPSKSQLWFSRVLPVLKFLCQSLVWKKIQRDDMDIVGAISAASSQLFHVLFMMICVQNAKTSSMLGLLLAWNVLQALVCCESMVKSAKKMDETSNTNPVSVVPGANQKEPQSNLIPMNLSTRILALLEQQPVVFRLFQLDQRVLLSSYYRYRDRKWASVNQQLLQTHLAACRAADTASPSDGASSNIAPPASGSAEGERQHYRNSSLGDRFGRKVRAMSAIIRSVATETPVVIHEANPTRVSTQSQEPSVQRVTSVVIHVSQVQRAIAALHSTEVILLRCYISIVAYILYGAYVLSVYYLLPNSEYILSLIRVTSTQEMSRTATKLSLLCATEVLILGTYLAIIRRVYGIDGTKQLAFALLSQRRIIQAKLVLWSVIIFSFPLLHSGNDVTFKFEWMRKTKSN